MQVLHGAELGQLQHAHKVALPHAPASYRLRLQVKEGSGTQAPTFLAPVPAPVPA